MLLFRRSVIVKNNMYAFPELALFDLDGTLIHHEEDYFYGLFSNIMEELGREPTSPERFQDLISHHNFFLDISDSERKKVESAFWQRFEQIVEHPKARLLDGSMETIEHFVSAGSKVAIVTARTHLPEDVEHHLAHTGLLKHIDVLSTLGEPHLRQYNSKPDLKVSQILSVCKKIGIDPQKSFMAGDTPTDITSGHLAGVNLVIGLLSGGIKRELLEQVEPHIILEHVGNIPHCFNNS